MAILKTQKVALYVPAGKIKAVMKYLQEAEIMEMTLGGKSLPESAMHGIERELEQTGRAIAIARKMHGGVRLFAKNKFPGADKYRDEKHIEASRRCVKDIIRVSEAEEENKREIEKLDESIRKCKLFLNYFGTSFFEETEYARAGVFYTEAWKGEEFLAALKDVPAEYEVIEKYKRCGVIFCVYLKSDAQDVERFLKEQGFSFPDFRLGGMTPAAITRQASERKKELLCENERLEKELSKLSAGLLRMELLYDLLLIKKEKYSAFSSSQNTEKVFILTGYVLKKRMDEFVERTTRLGAVAEKLLPSENEILPSAFSNNAFSRPVEEVTAGYSMPSGEDIDPNPVMSVFYYWFFGMMFSDSGYGILMMLVCGVLGFSGILKKDKRNMMQMFFWCGVSTTIWGVAYGSFFGDLIGTISNVFGDGRAEFSPILIDPVNQALELLIISVAFGGVHILTALVIKLICQWKSGDKTGAICDAGSWISVLLGGALFAVGTFLEITTVKYVGIALAILGALTLVILGGMGKKSIFVRIFAGILKLYDVTGFIGDLLSYSRLMALGLATGVIASVVNVLASLGGNSPLGIAIFIPVAIFGHTLNFAINILGAYVHTNRLQYVEFYQKFYQGGGRRFRPLAQRTRYFDIKEGNDI